MVWWGSTAAGPSLCILRLHYSCKIVLVGCPWLRRTSAARRNLPSRLSRLTPYWLRG